SFLFFAGDSSLINSTRHAGVFLAVYAVLLPIGFWQLVVARRDPVGVVVVLAFALSPVAAALVGEPHRINRALVMLPPGALVATAGIERLFAMATMRGRALGAAILAAAVIQFAWFYRDYLGDYRVRSAGWFERNIRGAVEDMLARARTAPPPAVYLSDSVP